MRKQENIMQHTTNPDSLALPKSIRQKSIFRIPLKKFAVQIKISRKRHPNKWSKKNLDGLLEVWTPESVKTEKYTSVIRNRGQFGATVRNTDIGKFGTRDETKSELQD